MLHANPTRFVLYCAQYRIVANAASFLFPPCDAEFDDFFELKDRLPQIKRRRAMMEEDSTTFAGQSVYPMNEDEIKQVRVRVQIMFYSRYSHLSLYCCPRPVW